MAADELAVLAVRDELDKTRGLIEASGLAVSGEREGSNLDIAVRELLLGSLFGVAEGSDLRVAEGSARHIHVVAQKLGLHAGDGLCGDNALGLSNVGELQLRGNVTDGIDVVHVGAHSVIDGDGAALGELNAGVLQAEALGAWGEADGDHGTVHGEGVLLGAVLRLDLNGDIVAVVLDGGGLVAGQQLNAKLLVLLGNGLGDVLVLVRQDAVHELHDGDVHAIVGQNISKFHADGAGADDDHGLRGLIVEDLLLVGHDVAAELNARQGLDHGAGCDDAVIEGDGLALVITIGDFDGLIVLEGAKAVDFGDLVLLHQVMDTLDDARGNLAGTLVGNTEVEGDIAGNAEVLGLVVEGVGNLSVLQQRLRGDAAYVEADTAPVLLLDYGNFLTKLSCTDGGHVAARARAEYYYVIMFISHAL